jgi:glycosyltransferase involved in cell wall biosynthesis
MQLPKISIVTPSYNQADFLETTINSILSQNYPNLEYIIIDGGSTDGSIDIIRRHSKALSYWCSEKDRGQSHAINKGFSRCTGTLFNWINSDDALVPGALKNLADAYLKDRNSSLYIGHHIRTDEKGRISKISTAPRNIVVSPSNWVFSFSQPSTFISSDVFRFLDGVNEDLSAIMDTDLYYRILKIYSRFNRINAFIGMIRTHAQAKGEAQKYLWDKELPAAWNRYMITKRQRMFYELRMRLLKTIDGSYALSLFYTMKWKNKFFYSVTG